MRVDKSPTRSGEAACQVSAVSQVRTPTQNSDPNFCDLMAKSAETREAEPTKGESPLAEARELFSSFKLMADS